MLLGKFIFGHAQVFNRTVPIFATGTLVRLCSGKHVSSSIASWSSDVNIQSVNSLTVAHVLQGIGAAGWWSVAVIIILDLTMPDTGICG